MSDDREFAEKLAGLRNKIVETTLLEVQDNAAGTPSPELNDLIGGAIRDQVTQAMQDYEGEIGKKIATVSTNVSTLNESVAAIKTSLEALQGSVDKLPSELPQGGQPKLTDEQKVAIWAEHQKKLQDGSAPTEPKDDGQVDNAGGERAQQGGGDQTEAGQGSTGGGLIDRVSNWFSGSSAKSAGEGQPSNWGWIIGILLAVFAVVALYTFLARPDLFSFLSSDEPTAEEVSVDKELVELIEASAMLGDWLNKAGLSPDLTLTDPRPIGQDISSDTRTNLLEKLENVSALLKKAGLDQDQDIAELSTELSRLDETLGGLAENRDSEETWVPQTAIYAASRINEAARTKLDLPSRTGEAAEASAEEATADDPAALDASGNRDERVDPDADAADGAAAEGASNS